MYGRRRADLRDALLGELGALRTDQELLAWAKRSLDRKNNLLQPHSGTVATAYREKLAPLDHPFPVTANTDVATTEGWNQVGYLSRLCYRVPPVPTLLKRAQEVSHQLAERWKEFEVQSRGVDDMSASVFDWPGIGI